MISAASLSAALLAGLLGSGHCVAMCGGIASTLQRGRASSPRRAIQLAVLHTGPQAAPHAYTAPGFGLPYAQIGRVISYTLAGALAGSIGSVALFVTTLIPVQALLFTLLNCAMIVLGLQMLGLMPLWSERLGAGLWKKIQPLMSGIWPPQNGWQQFLCGLAWGWVPCSLIYSMLPLALLSGNALHGALLMLAFGSATMPALLLLQWGGDWLAQWTQTGNIGPLLARRAGAIAIIGWGAIGLVHAINVNLHPGGLLGTLAGWCTIHY